MSKVQKYCLQNRSKCKKCLQKSAFKSVPFEAQTIFLNCAPERPPVNAALTHLSDARVWHFGGKEGSWQRGD
eukprot:6208846-Pleurochrysis_carterae.AAC.1